MSTGKRILLGALLAGAAAAFVVVVVMAFGARPERIIPGAVAGAVGAAIGSSARRKKQVAAQSGAQPEAKRPPQVVGSLCAACNQKIVFASDGKSCEKCGAPIHGDCATRHTCAA
jgi:hypothetical protein